jgi:predicted kinase
MIGAAASGKSTAARILACALQKPDQPPVRYISSSAIRHQLYGLSGGLGSWSEVEAVIQQEFCEALSAGETAIVEASYSKRAFRLAITQAMELPQPVQWIGWWLTTPLPTCLEWAGRRERAVPEAVIREFHAAIEHRQFGPCRAEGFAAIVTLNAAAGEADPDALPTRVGKLDGQIRNAVNKERGKLAHRHRYSRLLDLERLLFLLRLLTSFNGLDSSDPSTASALLEICNPPPEGDLAERAAAYLSRWSEVHGGNSDVYGDVEAIRGDLAWLESNGFTRLDWSSDGPIDPGPFHEPAGGGVNGGTPSLADALVFRRVFTLLRHILREPFDAPSGQVAAPKDGVPLYRHLIDRLTPIEGSYKPDQEAVLRNDLRHLLRPYGFSPEIKGRPDSLRQGYAIGTALLSADQLLEVHSLLKASMERLSDASQKPLLLTLEERLRRAGLLDAKAGRKLYGRRALAHRSFTEERSGTLAAREPSERIEQAIKDRRRVWLRHLPDPVTAAQRQ